MQTLLPYIIVALMFAVLGVLAFGIFAMAKGGKFNAKYSNKMMRLRVLLQGMALILLALLFFLSRS